MVEFLGLSSLSSCAGKRTEADIAGGTVKDVIDHLVKKHGLKASRAMLDKKGELDVIIQVMINGEGFLPREELSKRLLKENDRVRFMLLAGGG